MRARALSGIGGLLRSSVVPLVAVALALVIAGAMLALAGVNAVEAYRAMIRGAVGTRINLSITLTRAAPLILVGLGVAFAMRARFINVGGEGQLYMGALAGTWSAVTFTDLPSVLAIPLALAFAASAGSLWALIPGLLRAFRGTNEVITTILLNYVGVGIVSYFIYGPFRETQQSLYPQSAAVGPNARLPLFGPGIAVHLGFWLALGIAVLLSLVLYRTVAGYEIRLVGSAPRAADFVAVPARRRLLQAVVVAGGLAGIAGAVEILGVQVRLGPDFMTGVAFTGIVVALLGQNRPGGVVQAGVFIAALFNGADSMQRATATPSVIVYVVQALVVIFLLSGFYLRDQLNRSRSRSWGGALRVRRAPTNTTVVTSDGEV